MGAKEQLASEVGASVAGVGYTAGKMHIQMMCTGPSATDYTQIGDGNTALLASKTLYTVLGRLPKAGIIKSCIIRSANTGVAGATIDILKAASGTAISSGTAIVTQIAGNALTANTDYKMAVNSDGSENISAGSLIVAKIVTGAVETLKPLFVDIEIGL